MKGIFDISPDNLGTFSKEHPEWSFEAMTEEIKHLSSLEALMDQDSSAKGYLATCEAELTIKQLACREIAGKDEEAALATFSSYGLTDEYSVEAAKDVLARQAYIGSAKIKAMIAAIIKYVQELITFTATTNKGFKAVEKLAKKGKEALKKKQGSPKVTSDKFIREITVFPALTEEGKKAAKKFEDLQKVASESTASKESAKSFAENVLKDFLGSDVDATKPLSERLNEKKAELKDALDELKDMFNDKEEFEKAQLLTKMIENLSHVESEAKRMSKDKYIKNLEKIKAKLSKFTSESYIKKEFKASGKNKEDQDAGEFQTIIQNLMQVMSISITNQKAADKLMLSVFDRVVTEGKAVEAMLA